MKQIEARQYDLWLQLTLVVIRISSSCGRQTTNYKVDRQLPKNTITIVRRSGRAIAKWAGLNPLRDVHHVILDLFITPFS